MLCRPDTQDCLFAPQSRWPELLRVRKHDVHHRWQNVTVTTVFTIYGTAVQENLLAGLPHAGIFLANTGAKSAWAPAKPRGSTAGSCLAWCPVRAAAVLRHGATLRVSSQHRPNHGRAQHAGRHSPGSPTAPRHVASWPTLCHGYTVRSRGRRGQHGTGMAMQPQGTAAERRLPYWDYRAVPSACQGWLQ